jgi:hypothetical protein
VSPAGRSSHWANTCLWLDTGILVNSNFDGRSRAPAIVVTQDPWEYLDGSTHRRATWGLSGGRSLPGPLNSSVVRVTEHHKVFLDSWRQVLLGEAYVAEHAKPAHVATSTCYATMMRSALFWHQRSSPTIPAIRLAHSKDILLHHGARGQVIETAWRERRGSNCG